MTHRTGLGFDVHPFAPERRLFLGGVEFEGAVGLAGHSDADVVCHAVADALLGSAGLGDVGDHFPEKDPAVAGIGGLDLLGQVVAKVLDAGWRATFVDLTVIAERPSLAGRRSEMSSSLAKVLGLGADCVSVKATRPEGLGLTGDGIGCMAVATVASA